MEWVLVVFGYLTMLMYFDLLYRLFIPRIKFSYLFLSFFVVIVLGMGSLNIYVLPMQATFMRMVLSQIVIFLWCCICFEDSVEFKIFGCLCEIVLTYAVEMVCMLLYFLFTRERMIALLNDPVILLILRIGALIAHLLAYEVVIRTIRKYKLKQIPFFSIILPILFLALFIGNCIQGLAVYHDIEEWLVTTIATYFIVGVLLVWLLYGIYVEYQKKSKAILHTEIEKQYQTLLDDYLSISDTQQLQKYIRHDLLNHVRVLEAIREEK